MSEEIPDNRTDAAGLTSDGGKQTDESEYEKREEKKLAKSGEKGAGEPKTKAGKESKKEKDKKGKVQVSVGEEFFEEEEEEEEDEMGKVDFIHHKSMIPEATQAMPGLKRVTLSTETQEKLGCLIGVNVTAESPWVFVDKSLIEDHLIIHNESSEFLPIKGAFAEVKMTSLLIGYDSIDDEPNQFYICLTEQVQDHILQTLEEEREARDRRLQNSLQKTPQPWTSYGSEQEVEMFSIKNTRPPMRVLVETSVKKLYQPCNFSDRDVENVKDGYYRFLRREEPPDQIWCYRLEAGVQVRNPSVDAETQTRPTIPYNSWTQYEYEVDTDAPIEDEEVLKSLAQFLEKVEGPMTEILKYNEILDNYRNDYAKLVVNLEDTDLPQSFDFTEFLSFTDMKHCQGKGVSCVAFHPMWTGIVAIGYIEQGKVDIPKAEKVDEIALEVYSTNRVIIWSLNDAYNPKLILESPREVYSLAFAPHRQELLVGGLSNGQIVLWDIRGKIERVETEIKLTPAQIRYNLAMMNMMDWMKQTIKVQYLRPVAVSALEQSHTDTVYELRFLHPSWALTSAGRFELSENALSTLVMSLSRDNSIFIWNLDPTSNPVSSVVERARKRKTARRPDGLKTEVSPYAVFHRALTPSLKLDAGISNEMPGETFKCMDLFIPPLEYIPDEKEWAKLTPAEKASSATRFKFLPVLEPPELDDLVERAMVGTSTGQILTLEWSNSESKGTSGLQILNYDVKSSSHLHDGPVLRIIRSPFIEDLYLSVGWGKFALWSSKLKDNKPFLWRRPKGGKRYLSANWSSICPAVFRLCCSDGTIEVWDLSTQSQLYSILQNLSGKALSCLENHPRVLPSNLVGLADSTGCFRLFFIPMRYQETSHDSAEKLLDMVDHEVTRRKTMKRWVDEWKKAHAADKKKKAKEEEEEADKDAEVRRKSLLVKPLESSIELVRKPERKKEYGTAEKNIEARREHMVKMMMEKKKIDREDLERKRAPLVQAQEAMQLKQLKLREVMKNKNTIFKETVKVMFPEVAKKPPPKPTECEVLAGELLEKQDSFIEDYKILEATVLQKLRKPNVVDDFNWKHVVHEGRDRREVLDVKLYHQTEWKKRFEERRAERRLHRESELREEDEKRKLKQKGPYTSTSSQMIIGSDTFLDDDALEMTESRLLLGLQAKKMSSKQKQSKVGETQDDSKVILPPKTSVNQKDSKVILPTKEQSKKQKRSKIKIADE